jgi:cholesterol oxidase
MDFDVIVIGSGFGGAITSCRLAEAGYKVAILERGRRWDKHTYPRKPGDPWIWNYENPERMNGWLDLRVFPNM